MEFKVGDKVRVMDDADLKEVDLKRDDFSEPYGVVREIDKDACMEVVAVYFEDIDGYWWFAEDMLELVEETPKQVIFSPSQVTSAAEFLNINNRYIDESVEYFEELIYSYIKRAVVDGISMIGSAGFYVMINNVVENVVEVTVLVTPDVSSMKEYVEAELRNDKLVVEF